MPPRPKSETEQRKREIRGLYRACQLIRTQAAADGPITSEMLKAAHHEIFRESAPAIAGLYRHENIPFRASTYTAPDWKLVSNHMLELDQYMEESAKKLASASQTIANADAKSEELTKTLKEVLECASYVHHAITQIRPFRDGNGRIARLCTNLVLMRYGLVGVSSKIEQQNKHHYYAALGALDAGEGCDALIALTIEGLLERYHAIPLAIARDPVERK